jgi:hypothetical protein
MTQKRSIPGWVPLIVILIVIIIAIVFVTFDGGLPAGTANTTGTLNGKVSIGPLCPVEPCTIPHDRLVAAYAARPITISTPDGIVVTTVTADPEIGYTVALKQGTYIVTLPKQGIGGSPDLPATVTIRSGETVVLDISIDTGIR